MKVRSETITDYHKIAEINALAFAPYLEEPLTSTFVTEFALVGQRNGGEGSVGNQHLAHGALVIADAGVIAPRGCHA